MTILQKLVNRLDNKLSGTGHTIYILTSHNKHPRQNQMLKSLRDKLVQKGLNVSFRLKNQTVDDRGILIVYDGKPTLKRDGIWAKVLRKNSPIRLFITVGHPYEEDDFEGDFTLQNEITEEDTDGVVTIQIWKRVKVRING